MTRIRIAAAAGLALALIGTATAGVAADAAPAAKARPTLHVQLDPAKNQQWYHTVYVYVRVTGSHGAVHGKLSATGIGGFCQDKYSLRTRKNGSATRACHGRNMAKLGEHTVRVTYFGSKKYAARSTTVSFDVTKVHTAMQLTAKPASPVKPGTPVVLRAELDDNWQGSNAGGPSSGTVAFSTGSSSGSAIAGCGQAAVSHLGVATCHTTLPAGTRQVHAEFSGSTYYRSVSKSIDYVVKS